jgi:hypothetical protein
MVDRVTFSRDVVCILGVGRRYASVVSSLAIVLTSFFYIYTISSYFKIGTYILDNRVTYVDYFEKYIINKAVDYTVIEVGIIIWFLFSFRGKARFYIAFVYGGMALIGLLANLSTITEIMTLISLPLVFFFLIYNRFTSKKILYVSSDLAVNYVAIICTLIGAASILMSLPPIFSSLSSSFPVRNYTYDIFSLFSVFSPILMVLIIFCLPLKMIINAFSERILKTKYSNNNNTAVSFAGVVRRRNKILYLLLFILLSMILVLIPHQPAINKDDQKIGVDTTYYVNWLGNLTSTNNTQDFLRQAFVVQSDGDRPLALMFFFTLVKVIHVDSFHTMEYIPIILGPLLILVVYFLTRELTSSDVTSILAAFLTAISFHILVGIYAGLYANWLALIIGYASSTFFIRFLRESQKISYILFSALMTILVLTHIYTWSILAIVFTVFLAVMLITKYYQRRNIILLLLVIVLSVGIDVSRTALTGSAGGVIKDLEIADTGAGIELFSQRWTTLTETIHIYLGGQFSNFIILGLCLYWLFLSDLNKTSNIFIAIFLSIGILPLFFGNWALLNRVFYDIPFQIPAAIALTHLKEQSNKKILVVPICIWLIAMPIIAVSNFYLILPS